LDCPDPSALVAFYLDLLGGELLWQNADSAGAQVPGATLVAQRVTPYIPPTWLERPSFTSTSRLVHI